MNAAAILHKLREGNRPDLDELRWFAQGIADGRITDSQAGAFAMAVCHVGLGEAGRVALTEAMRDSGDVLKWDLPAPVLDKHSTGGIGDCVSIPLAPALAACGAFVPMVSGRGLGHTGGTLDKLESIPGLQTNFSTAAFKGLVAQNGCAIVSASGDIAPADRRLYAIRDVTGTVESIDLITASILSKKLAAGLQGLVMDVKTGSGAFMPELDMSRALAQSIVSTASNAGCPTVALITDMSQPLASSAGNTVEIIDSMLVLEGDVTSPLAQVTCALGGELLAIGGLAASAAQGGDMIRDSLSSGTAMEYFGRMVAAQGGAPDFTSNWRDMLRGQNMIERPVPAPSSGVVQSIDSRAVGMAVVELGGGRKRGGEEIDHAVGLSNILRIGDAVEKGDPLCVVLARTEDQAQAAIASLHSAIHIGDSATPPVLIHERITA